MSTLKEQVEFLEKAIRSRSHHITVYAGFGSIMLTEIRNTLDQHPPPDDDLVEEAAGRISDCFELNSDESCGGYLYYLETDEAQLRIEIRKLLQERQPGKVTVTREEIMKCVDIWQVDHADNVIELLKSKGLVVVEK